MTVRAVTNEVCFLQTPALTGLSSLRTFCAGGDSFGVCSGESCDKYLNNFAMFGDQSQAILAAAFSHIHNRLGPFEASFLHRYSIRSDDATCQGFRCLRKLTSFCLGSGKSWTRERLQIKLRWAWEKDSSSSVVNITTSISEAWFLIKDIRFASVYFAVKDRVSTHVKWKTLL